MKGPEPPCTGESMFVCYQWNLPEEDEQPRSAAGAAQVNGTDKAPKVAKVR